MDNNQEFLVDMIKKSIAECDKMNALGDAVGATFYANEALNYKAMLINYENMISGDKQ